MHFTCIKLRVRDRSSVDAIRVDYCPDCPGCSPNCSIYRDGVVPLENQQTVRLQKKCDFAPLIVFLWHYVKWPEYRERVAATLKFALSKLSLLQGPNTASHLPVIPVKVTICFTLVNCDSISPVDKSWCFKILKYAILRMEIEEALSWLSTLGGAYSSLGDRNVNFAKKAGQVSMNQLRLSYVFGDPNLIARCFIYMSHSLCQQGHRKKAIKFVKKCLYPRMVLMGDKCDRIVAQMYQSLCYRIRFIYK